MKIKKYQTHYETLKTQLSTLDTAYNKISLFRLVTFLSGIILMVIFRNITGLIFLLAGFITFCALINKHNQIEKSIKKLKSETLVTEKMLSRFDGSYKSFADDGSEYLSSDFHPGNDLDIFEKSSVYQLICRAYTKEGKEKFVSVLKNGFNTPDEIKTEQEAVKEIISNDTFSKEFETGLAMMISNKNKDEITASELSSLSLPKTPFVLKALSFLLPLISIICAKETIGRLTGEDSIVFVTTHDFELCSADFSGVTPVNLHFCEHYENDEIKFDYKLKEGMCKTTNAKELLKMVGISKEITK